MRSTMQARPLITNLTLQVSEFPLCSEYSCKDFNIIVQLLQHVFTSLKVEMQPSVDG